MALSMAAVVGLAYDAGLRDPRKLAQAAAIATAESGRDPTKRGDIALQDGKWGPSVGLWQIRSLKAEKGKGTTRDESKLTDPAFNAKAMMEISKGGADWGPWTVTHVTNVAGYGRYQLALPTATGAVAVVLPQKGAGVVGDAAGAVTEPIAQLAGVISDTVQTPVRVINWLTEGATWQRIGYFAMGFALVIGGVWVATGKPGEGTVKTVVRAVSPTKAVKALKGR